MASALLRIPSLYKNTPPIPPPILIGVVFLYKPAAGGNFLGYIHPFLKGYIPVYEGEMKHFGGPNRCKNEGKRRERETKGVFFSGASSGAQKSIKSINF